MSRSMLALVGGSGPDWVMREVAVPAPGAGQVLVRVWAAGVNRADLGMLGGSYNPAGMVRGGEFTAGLELAGEVEGVGPGVDGVEAGDRVMAAALGSFAAFALVDHRHLMPVPSSLAWTDAASLPVGLSTEHDALGQAGFGAGDRVLVVGATSGVGMLGVQLAKALGAGLVVATTTSATKVGALTAIGAGLVIDTGAGSMIEAVLA